MAYTAFISKSAAGNAAHNAREFSEKHPEPDYLLPPQHRQRNIHIKTNLTADQVQDEYLTTTRFGLKHGRLHHKAKPIREAVIVCKMNTTENQVRMLMIALEDRLGVRPMYAHVHKDEGHIDEDTGKVKYNPHIHLGYTNLVNGELTHMNQRRMRQAQDLCAAGLGMERAKTYKARKEDGEIDKNPKHKDHHAYRAQKQAEAKARKAGKVAADKDATERINAAVTRAKTAETANAKLVEVNAALRKQLKDSGIAKQEDYQVLKQIKDSDLSLDEKLDKMGAHVHKVYTRVEETTAEPRSATSPVTPEREIATPPPVPVQAPAPAVPLFADVLRDWRREERKKREAAEKEAAKAAEAKATKAAEEKIKAAEDRAKTAETERDKAQKQWELWEKDAKENAKQRDQAQGMMRTLGRFIMACSRGFNLKWPKDMVELIANQKPDMWFNDEFFKSVGEKLNNLVDMFDTSQKTIPAPAPERTRAPTRAMDDDEQEQ